jgi:hypothetical protein
MAEKTYVPRPTEMPVLDYHRQHLAQKTFKLNPDGSITTFMGTIVGNDDAGYQIIPTYWHGELRNPEQAMRFALKSGIAFPKYKTLGQAESAEKALHTIMEQDVADFVSKQPRR